MAEFGWASIDFAALVREFIEIGVAARFIVGHSFVFCSRAAGIAVGLDHMASERGGSVSNCRFANCVTRPGSVTSVQ